MRKSITNFLFSAFLFFARFLAGDFLLFVIAIFLRNERLIGVNLFLSAYNISGQAGEYVKSLFVLL